MAKVVRHFETPTDPIPALRDVGWKLSEQDGFVEATQGSQWRTRLLGGWFVSYAALPKHLEASRAASGESYEVRVSSTFGFGYIDPRFRQRYEDAFDDLKAMLQR